MSWNSAFFEEGLDEPQTALRGRPARKDHAETDLPDLPRLAQDVSAHRAGRHAVPVGSLDLADRDQPLAGGGHEHVHPPPAPAGFRDAFFDLDLTLGILEPVRGRMNRSLTEYIGSQIADGHEGHPGGTGFGTVMTTCVTPRLNGRASRSAECGRWADESDLVISATARSGRGAATASVAAF